MAFLKILSGFYLFLPFILTKIAPPLIRVERNSLKLSARVSKEAQEVPKNVFPEKHK
jgi:hypothetical protein